MPHYDRFIFQSYSLDTVRRTIELRYSLDEKINIVETLSLPAELSLENTSPQLEAALFAIHLAGGVSYYKTYLPKTIEIRSGQLTADQATFWNTLYTRGLGEFFYANQLDFHGLISFPASKTEVTTIPATPESRRLERVLIPFGGGKDSIVTTELLRTQDLALTLFRVRSHPLITQLAQTTNLPLLGVDRQLDPKLTELTAAGAYNGHVPITAYISFISVAIGILGGYDGVAFSNERSSSYGNIEYLGMTINHQWSKSLEAENLIRSYIQQHVTTRVQYLNPLRPLSELKIASIFATYPQYFGEATSCNRNWTLIAAQPQATRWCGTCPKCAFSFVLLAAYLDEPTLTSMFGQNLFGNPKLLPLYRELWGETGFKPFECVGTPEETQAAFYLASQNPQYANTTIVAAFNRAILPTIPHPKDLVAGLLQAGPSL